MRPFSESVFGALLVEPEQPPREVWVENSRAGILAHIGGNILLKHDRPGDAACYLFGGGYCPNRAVFDESGNVTFTIYGPFLVAGRLFADRLCSLCPEQAQAYSSLFHVPHVFLRENGQVVLLQKSDFYRRRIHAGNSTWL